MTYDINVIKEVEESLDARSMYRLYKEERYMHRKVMNTMSDKLIKYPVRTIHGFEVELYFIRNKDLEEARLDRRFGEPKERRKVMGRPFLFCRNCPVRTKCSADIHCPERDEYIAKRNAPKHIEDERYYLNGNPRKHLILCQYSRYKGGLHKGECQKELCAFYSQGNCELSLYK